MSDKEFQELKKLVDAHSVTISSMYSVPMDLDAPTTSPAERLRDLENSVEELERTYVTKREITYGILLFFAAYGITALVSKLF